MLVFLAGSFAVGVSALGVTTDAQNTPYQSIVDRNVFALKPPPPPPDPEATKPPPVKITLTGITTILGNKRALMKSPAPPGKPGEPAKPEVSYILTVGQREGDVEVIDIDERDRQRAVAIDRSFDLLRQALLEELAVVRAGQRIGDRDAMQPHILDVECDRGRDEPD